MKRVIIYLLLMVPIIGQADLLTDLLDKKYDAKTLTQEQMDSLLNNTQEMTVDEMLLPQNRYKLHYEEQQKIFRRSFWAHYYLMDTKKNERIEMNDTVVREAQMSPNGQYVVYGKGQNLYIYKVLFRTEIAITNEKNDIFCGLSDWLYEEEFNITRLFAFSPDSKQVAFVRLDEHEVPTFSWQVFRNKQYPETMSLRYPKAGEKNAAASVCIYDISTKGIRTIQLPEMEDSYIPRLHWRNENELVIERINRDQNQLNVYVANPKTTLATPLYSEQSDKFFVDCLLFDQWQWLSDGRFIAVSEENGWRQLYLHSAQGQRLMALTPAKIDVTNVYGVDEKTGTVYYEAAPIATERQVYAVNIKNGKVTPLTNQSGTHTLTFSKDMKRAVGCFQSETTANHYTLYSVQGSALKESTSTSLIDRINAENKDIEQAWETTELPHKQFIRIPTERGDTLGAWIILPKELTDLNQPYSRQYPVVIMQYSGPASQRVLNRWRHRFGHYLAGQGYIVVNADPRGTDCRGRAWRNATYMRLGEKEAQDQLSVAHYMQSLPAVNGKRIAMIGWSYGAFQTIRTMCEKQDLIRCGIAIAPVTDWRLYDTGYTERYMRRPQVNEEGYEAANLIRIAPQLQGKLLLVHATGDDNVHFQNTLLLSDALVRAGKDFDTQIYVDDNHSLLDKANNEHLHRKILTWLEKQL
ncbi:MAG: S9 family peptidase [Paludibacteraceae bacterium]|nr:S9 family peptidase [Paludibacteraceae bacterium]